jgi:hypothetical protein
MDYFKNIIIKISKYEDDYSIRFYPPQDKISIGTLRITTTPGTINDAYIITSMEINRLIAYIMAIHNLPVQMGDAIVMTIRNYSVNKLKQYINGGE